MRALPRLVELLVAFVERFDDILLQEAEIDVRRARKRSVLCKIAITVLVGQAQVRFL